MQSVTAVSSCLIPVWLILQLVPSVHDQYISIGKLIHLMNSHSWFVRLSLKKVQKCPADPKTPCESVDADAGLSAACLHTEVKKYSEQVASDRPKSLFVFMWITYELKQYASTDSRLFNHWKEERVRLVSCQHLQEIVLGEAMPHTPPSADLFCSPLKFSRAVSINNCIVSLASEWLYNQTAICSSTGTGPAHCDSNWTERREEEREIARWHLRNEI